VLNGSALPTGALSYIGAGPPSATEGGAAAASLLALPGGKVTVAVEIDSLGDETVVLFTLNFDASILSNPTVTLGDGMPEGITLTANTLKGADGRVIVLLDSATPLNAGYSKRVVTVTIDVAKYAAVGETPITFDRSGSFSNIAADSLAANYGDGVVSVRGRSTEKSVSRRLAPNYWYAHVGILGLAGFRPRAIR